MKQRRSNRAGAVMPTLFLLIAACMLIQPAMPAPASEAANAAKPKWTIEDKKNDELPGRRIDIRHGQTLRAAFIYGQGQDRAYLALYDDQGRRLTNPGLNLDGGTRGRFPHHRGIYVGWNHLHSDLGRDDLWHLRNGEQILLHRIVSQSADGNSAALVVELNWHSARRDDELRGLLLVERRTMTFSVDGDRLIVDHQSTLTASRDIRLEGDLHHAGTQIRVDADVDAVRNQTVYLWEPGDLDPGRGRVVSGELRWVHFRFPLHGRWYAITQINPPSNKVEELSWRDYGRFGFFFKDRLDKDESLTVNYRFIIEESQAPAAPGEARQGQDRSIRQKADNDHRAFANLHPSDQ